MKGKSYFPHSHLFCHLCSKFDSASDIWAVVKYGEQWKNDSCYRSKSYGIKCLYEPETFLINSHTEAYKRNYTRPKSNSPIGPYRENSGILHGSFRQKRHATHKILQQLACDMWDSFKTFMQSFNGIHKTPTKDETGIYRCFRRFLSLILLL